MDASKPHGDSSQRSRRQAGPGSAWLCPPCCALAGYELPTADSAPLATVREELHRLNAAILELKAKLLGPVPVAVSVEEAAAILGCGRTQVFKYLAQGKLTRAKQFGRRVAVSVASIEALQAPKKERRPHVGRRPRNIGASIRALPLGEEQDRKDAPRTTPIRPPSTRDRGAARAGPRDAPA